MYMGKLDLLVMLICSCIANMVDLKVLVMVAFGCSGLVETFLLIVLNSLTTRGEK